MNRILHLLLAVVILAAPLALAAPPLPPDPAYVQLDDGYRGFWAQPGEYVEYTLPGGVQLQDAYHILLAPETGLMLTFADRKDLAAGKGRPVEDKSMLQAHRDWELAYWREHAPKVESKPRDDLAGGRHDLMVTEIAVQGPDQSSLKALLIGVAAKNGVFAFSISPATPELDAMVRRFIASIKVVHKRLDLPAEAKRIAAEPPAQP